MKSVCVHSHAKVNFYLDVVRRRRDGYHDIETLFQTISLADTLVVEVRPAELSMECSNPALECGPSNLVLKAAEMLRKATGCRIGAHMNLAKRVPIAAGLAGGSGNAAAALVALNALWNLDLPNARLRRMALALGSDVPYCLEGGTVAATGRGERMCKLNPVPESWLVLVHPPFAVSTRAVYTSPLLHISEERPFAGRTPS
ncbi:MAG: 4-(cytidine 5'-diphospho)-2-C-methyl-D-erythritol kinase, partial [Candidatus Hydrogenedentales bacterium]